MIVNSQPIGVFDSGAGGLTVLKHLIRTMPSEHFIYLGDTARLPYGNKSASTVQKYSLECSLFLLEHSVKLIVVACNTASALALPYLAQRLSIPVVGVIEPAAEFVARKFSHGNVGVIGTRATVESNVYGKTIRLLSNNRLNVFSVACPLFVPMIEEGFASHPIAEIAAGEYLEQLSRVKLNALVLGCTHYPVLKNVLAGILPNIVQVDCGECVAEYLVEHHADMLSPKNPDFSGTIRTYVTDYSPWFDRLALLFIGKEVAPAEVVRVHSQCADTDRLGL